MAPAQAFETMHMGFYELSVAPFLGLGLTAAHAAGLAALFGDLLRSGAGATPPGRARLGIALAALGAIGCAVTLAIGFTSAALVLAAATLWLAVTRWVPPVRPDRLPIVVDRKKNHSSSVSATATPIVTRLCGEITAVPTTIGAVSLKSGGNV